MGKNGRKICTHTFANNEKYYLQVTETYEKKMPKNDFEFFFFFLSLFRVIDFLLQKTTRHFVEKNEKTKYVSTK